MVGFSVWLMDVDGLGGGWGGAPPWLDAVSESDLLDVGDGEGDELLAWDEAEVAELLAAGLGPLSPVVPEVAVVEVLTLVQALGPGPAAISLLGSLAGRELSADEQLTVVQCWQPLVGWVAGAESAAVAAFASSPFFTQAVAEVDPATPAYARFSVLELAAAELGPALGVTIGFAKARILTAASLAPDGRFPRVGALLRSGEIGEYASRVLVAELELLPEVVVEAVQDVVLAKAGWLSPNGLKDSVRRNGKRLVGVRDPQAVLASFLAAQRTRRVWFNTESQDGLVVMGAHLPAVEAMAIQQLLHRDAGGRHPHDPRCRDEREADALMARILGAQTTSQTGGPGAGAEAEGPLGRGGPVGPGGRGPRGGRGAQRRQARRAERAERAPAAARPITPVPVAPKIQLNVLVPLSTLLGGNDHPGELAGYGDLPPAVVRALAGDATWQRWLYDDATGHLLDLGTHRYTPTPELDRYIRARDPHCRFPFSTTPSTTLDLDHHQPFDATGEGNGGTTSAENLGPLTRLPHRLKTHGKHHLRTLTGGTLAWTTALARTYHTQRHDHRPDNGTHNTNSHGDRGGGQDGNGDDPPPGPKAANP